MVHRVVLPGFNIPVRADGGVWQLLTKQWLRPCHPQKNLNPLYILDVLLVGRSGALASATLKRATGL